MRGILSALVVVIAIAGLLFATTCDAQIIRHYYGGAYPVMQTAEEATTIIVATDQAIPVWRSGPLGLVQWRYRNPSLQMTAQNTITVRRKMSPTAIYPQRWSTGVIRLPLR